MPECERGRGKVELDEKFPTECKKEIFLSRGSLAICLINETIIESLIKYLRASPSGRDGSHCDCAKMRKFIL